jgi:hypothetical protein
MKSTLHIVTAMYLACALLFWPQLASAQGSGAKSAIEQLENCSGKEQRSGCVKILKKRKPQDDRVRVKAQIRGGRIIWYEYNQATGRVRRLN